MNDAFAVIIQIQQLHVMYTLNFFSQPSGRVSSTGRSIPNSSGDQKIDNRIKREANGSVGSVFS